MDTLFIGQTVLEFEELASTNEYVVHLLKSRTLTEGSVVLAHYQSWGKGYGSAQWVSERRKNLLVSILLKPQFLPVHKQFLLNQVVCLALSDTISKFLPEHLVKIKWPNDIYLNNKKIAGVLIKNLISGDVLQHSVVGMGININQTVFDSLPNAFSLAQAAGAAFNVKAVLENVCSSLETRYLALKNNHSIELEKDYLNQLYRIEEECWFSTGGKKFISRIVGLTPEGRLLLNQDGELVSYGFKEVEMII